MMNEDKIIKEIKKDLDGFRLNVVLGLDVNYDVYKESDIIRVVTKALSKSNKEIEELRDNNNQLSKSNNVWFHNFRDLTKEKTKLKHQLQTQRDDMFKEIDEEVVMLQESLRNKIGELEKDEPVNQEYSDKYEGMIACGEDMLNNLDKLRQQIEHLKQKHKEE